MNAKLTCAVFGILGLSASMLASAQNLVTNGSFSTGNFSGWTQSGNTSDTFVDSGPPTSAQLGPVGSLGYLTQNLTTSVGSGYRLTYELSSDGQTPNQFQTTVGGTTVFQQSNIPLQGLTLYTFNFTATSTTTTLQFGFEDDPGYLGLTDISVTLLSSPILTLTFTTAGLTANQRGPVSSINQALISGQSSPALTTVTTALIGQAGSTASLGAAADELAPTKFQNFASTTAFNNEAFAVQDMDIYLEGERTGPQGTFTGGNGRLDTHNFVVEDPNVDPGLQMVHSRMLAWNDLPPVISDVPGAMLGGIDMKAIRPAAAPAANETPWNVFLRGNVVLAQGFSQADVPHFDDNTVSVTAGADYKITDHVLAGLTASYAHTDATLDDAGSSATVDSYSPGIYASYADSGWYGNLVGRYSHNTYSESRAIPFLGQTASGGTDGNEGVADLDGGYEFHSGAWTYGPVAGVQYTHLTVDGYSEGGSDASLQVNKDESDSLRSRLGGSVRFDVAGCGLHFSPHLTATWEHEFLDESRGVTSQFTNFAGGSFVVRTPGASDDFALADVGIDAQVGGDITVFGDYLVQAGQSNYFGQSVQAGVRINF